MIERTDAATPDSAADVDTELRDALAHCVRDPELHARWLNTLSLMENCGARKIARFEHPVAVTTTILKHASEEFRHAFSLKRQIVRVRPDACPDYHDATLVLGPMSRRYLDRLDVAVCRYLKHTRGLTGWELRHHAYLLVTWAIEVRAAELYPLYQAVLEEAGLPVSVRAIIAEEDLHLADMEAMLQETCGASWRQHTAVVRAAEEALFARWRARLIDVLSGAHDPK